MMINKIYMYYSGYLIVSVEGFFIERFLNICRNQKIAIEELEKKNSTYLIFKILKSDFKKIKSVAKNTKCKIRIIKKLGIPFLINRYRKRKVFAVALVVIAIFIFTITRFIWNIEIKGNENIKQEEMIELLEEYGIKCGTLKSKINKERIGNLIRLNRSDISWIGISIKGTNACITIEEAIEKPEIIDRNEICNIVADESGVISKITVQNGTARVNVGDEVKNGDLLVEGVMEGVNTGVRKVHAEADIFAKILYEKEKKEWFVQNVKNKTGNIEEKNEICINNFKIILNKGVSKFQNYDTITSNKKLKIFSDFYLPITINKVQNVEYINEKKIYTEEELKNKILTELEMELESEFEISKYDENNIIRNVYTDDDEDGLTVKLVYEVQKAIGTKTKENT